MRVGKDICWHDCNLIRIDEKCSENCRYSLKHSSEKGGIFILKTNADSQLEYRDLLRRQMDKWVISVQPVFSGKIPLEMAAGDQGRKELTDFFNSFDIPAIIPLEYLKKRLDLERLKIREREDLYEENAAHFLDLIITREWEKLIELLSDSEKYHDEIYRANFIKRYSQSRFMKKINEYELISSALSEPKDKALVYFEINRRYDLTILMEKVNQNWLIDSRIFGKPELVKGENETYQQVALLISQNELAAAEKLLEQYSGIYPDSSDLHYYAGLIHAFRKDKGKAEASFLTACELDPEFSDAKYNYALIKQSTGDINRAEVLYREILQNKPEEIKSMNNLAAIWLDKGQLQEARRLLEKIIKLDKDFAVAQQNLKRLEQLEIDKSR
ncbi:MAG: tetratricopeptide repeat protein [Candidatus Cloacimonetes bacterium]|nr:tetratricopeptide repeat protein [Candidatus Cloacimonadota bacterium]